MSGLDPKTAVLYLLMVSNCTVVTGSDRSARSSLDGVHGFLQGGCVRAGADEPSVSESVVSLPADESELGDPATAASRCSVCDQQFHVL